MYQLILLGHVKEEDQLQELLQSELVQGFVVYLSVGVGNRGMSKLRQDIRIGQEPGNQEPEESNKVVVSVQLKLFSVYSFQPNPQPERVVRKYEIKYLLFHPNILVYFLIFPDCKSHPLNLDLQFTNHTCDRFRLL